MARISIHKQSWQRKKRGLELANARIRELEEENGRRGDLLLSLATSVCAGGFGGEVIIALTPLQARQLGDICATLTPPEPEEESP